MPMIDPDGPVRTGHEPEDAFPIYDHGARECMLNRVRAYTLVWPQLEALFRHFGLNGGAFNVLMILRSAEAPLQPYVIGQRALVTRSAITAILAKLERQELISRATHPIDRRMFLIEITPRGRALAERILPHAFRLEHSIFSCLTVEEQETLIALLGKVEQRARQVEAAQPVDLLE
jgi:DNA-binding MarR family transcriptional regulator